MFLRPLLLAATLAVPATAASARDLAEVLQVPRVIELLRAEGLAQGESLAADLFPDSDPTGFIRRVGSFYDASAMEATMTEFLQTGMDDAVEAEVLDFFASDLGMRIVDLELSAREAIRDESIEEAAIEAWSMVAEEDPDRAALIDEFIAVNGLIEENVQGGLNSNLEFMQGMNAGGAFDPPLDESMMLSDIWGAEPEIRQETSDWLHGYLGLAYAPLTEQEIRTYIDFSASEAGQAFNRVLFEAFDAMYDGVTFEVGRTAAFVLTSEDI